MGGSHCSIEDSHECFILKMNVSLLYFLSIKLRDKIATGSFDKTCKLWCAETGKCFHTYRGHMGEIVCIMICFK